MTQDTPRAKEGLLRCYQKVRDTEQLIDLYKNMLFSDETNTHIRMQLIEILYAKEMFAEAALETEYLLGYTHLDNRLQRLLAICYRKTKRFRDAAVLYRELLKEEPDSEMYLRSLLYCLEKSKRRKQALELLESAMSYLTKPSSSLDLIHGVFLHKEKKIEEALSSFRSAMEKAPEDWRSYYNIGQIYHDKGMDSFSTKFFRKAEELKKTKKLT